MKNLRTGVLALFIAMAAFFWLPPANAAKSWRHAKVSYHSPYRGYTLAARGVPMGTTYEFMVGKRVARGKVVDACGRKMRGWGRKFDLSDELFTHLFKSKSAGTGHLKYRMVKRGKGRLIPA